MNKEEKEFSRRKKILILTLCILGCFILLFFSPMGYTVRLNRAIRDNDEERVEKLLKWGGDINRDNSIPIMDIWEHSPIEEACIKGNINIIKMLIEKGADIDEEGWSPLILVLASEYSNQYEIVELLIDEGANVNNKNSSSFLTLISGKYDPRFRSVYNITERSIHRKENTFEIFMILVNNGADLKYWEGARRFQSSYSSLILRDTVIQGELQILEYLIEQANYDVNEKLYGNETPLIVAVKNKDERMVTYLLLQGADKELKGNEGKTALDLAKENDYQKIVKLLE